MRLFVAQILVTVSVALPRPDLVAQSRGPTLPEAVRARGGPLGRSTEVDLAPTTLRELIEEADVIVRARVGRSRSYLSDDEDDILTDHALEPVEFIRPVASSFGVRPGISQPDALTVTQRGGAIAIDGHRVTSQHSALPPLQPGTEAILFLVRNGDKFRLVRNYLGVFALAKGTVTTVSKSGGIGAQVKGMPLDQFLSEVRLYGRANGR